MTPVCALEKWGAVEVRRIGKAPLLGLLSPLNSESPSRLDLSHEDVLLAQLTSSSIGATFPPTHQPTVKALLLRLENIFHADKCGFHLDYACQLQSTTCVDVCVSMFVCVCSALSSFSPFTVVVCAIALYFQSSAGHVLYNTWRIAQLVSCLIQFILD